MSIGSNVLFTPTLQRVQLHQQRCHCSSTPDFNQGLRQNGARPPIFHFCLADSIYQQCPDKNKICNLSPSRAKPPRWTGLPGGQLGQASDCTVIKGHQPFGKLYLKPKLTELFKTDRGENMKLKFVMTDISMRRPEKCKAKQTQKDPFIFTIDCNRKFLHEIIDMHCSPLDVSIFMKRETGFPHNGGDLLTGWD